MIDDRKLTTLFRETYGTAPTLIARAPGRINLIGEHTDYNGGFVLPAAINREIRMAARVRAGAVTTRLRSANFGESHEFDSAGSGIALPAKKGWANFFLAVADQFVRRGAKLPALDVAIDGDVPLGAGLSSSAAYEVCAAVLYDHLCGTRIARRDIALLAQAAEHSPFVGVRCGIMDQFASALGAEAHALRIDCHSLDYDTVPFDPAGAAIVIINTNKPRELRDSDYNRRRAECEEGLARLRELAASDASAAGDAPHPRDPRFPTLRHVPAAVFARHEGDLPADVARRVRHNLSENARVNEFVAALETGDWTTAGRLLYASHTSLRDDFQVSCAELDAIVEIARTLPGVHGCRMTGGGFGGCAVALVRPDAVDAFAAALAPEYRRRTGLTPDIYTSPPAEGAGIRAVDPA